MRSSEILTKSFEIWMPNLDQIDRDPARTQLAKSPPPFKIAALHWFQPKPIAIHPNRNRVDQWFSTIGGGQLLCHLKWSGWFRVGHKPDPWTALNTNDGPYNDLFCFPFQSTLCNLYVTYGGINPFIFSKRKENKKHFVQFWGLHKRNF